MSGSTYGNLFKIVTFGESHGKAIGVVIDGVKPNTDISIEEIQRELDRRKPGQSSITTPRKEEDKVDILSGIFNGKTTGTPICLIIWNKDQNPEVYKQYKDVFRPGHAGYSFIKKYGIFDYYGGGRASGRETAARVAAGAIARQILKQMGVEIIGYTKQVGHITIKSIDYNQIEKNSSRCPDPIAAEKIELLIKQVRDSGDSIGGVVEIVIKNCPAGLGEPVFNKLNAELGKALLSIGAVKGFEIGDGFKVAKKLGSNVNDEFYFSNKEQRVRTRTNRQGGILGGISVGEDIICRIAVKPPSSILRPHKSIDYQYNERTISIEGRHDPCLCPRIVPVAEAMIALVILDLLMLNERLKEKNEIEDLRKSIDVIDNNLLYLLSLRNEYSKKIGNIKKKLGKSILDKNRENIILKNRYLLGKNLKLEKSFILKLFKLIFTKSKKIQKI